MQPVDANQPAGSLKSAQEFLDDRYEPAPCHHPLPLPSLLRLLAARLPLFPLLPNQPGTLEVIEVVVGGDEGPPQDINQEAVQGHLLDVLVEIARELS